jgi:hypothetical protein
LTGYETLAPKLETTSAVRPDYLYKYLSLEPEHIESTLSEASLWFSRPEDFNDPFDLRAFFHFNGGTNKQRNELYEESIAVLVQKDERFTEAGRASLVQEYQRKYPTLEQARAVGARLRLTSRNNVGG